MALKISAVKPVKCQIFQSYVLLLLKSVSFIAYIYTEDCRFPPQAQPPCQVE